MHDEKINRNLNGVGVVKLKEIAKGASVCIFRLTSTTYSGKPLPPIPGTFTT